MPWRDIGNIKGPAGPAGQDGQPGATGPTGPPGPPGTTVYSSLTGLPTLGTAAALNVPASGNAASNQVVLGSDTRLGTGSSTGTDSITGTSTLTLVGDVITPTNGQFYGYSGSARGWYAVPLPTTTAPGLVPTLPATSGSGQQVDVYLRGDASWQQLPEMAFTAFAFTVPAIGSTVTITLFAAAPWATVRADVYYSDGTHRGFMSVTANGGSTNITLQNNGNGTPGDVVALNARIKLTGEGLATATQSGLIPIPPNLTTQFLRGDASFAQVAYANVTGTPTQPVALTSTVGGLTPNVTPNSASQVLLGSGVWGTLAYSALSGSPSIPTVGTLTTSDSITGGGAMTGNLTILLSGDSASPGNTMLYGTNGGGTKGWYAQPAGGGGSSTGADSITGTTTVTLVNDSASPGNDKVYGTTSGGTLGYRSASALPVAYSSLTGTPTTIATFTVNDGNPPASAYAYFTTRDSGGLGVWRFAVSVASSLVFCGIVPQGITFTTGIQVIIWWAAVTATTNSATWTASLDNIAAHSIDSDSYGTGVSVSTTVNGVAAVTNSTTISLPNADLQSLAAEQPYKLKIVRAGNTDSLVDSA